MDLLRNHAHLAGGGYTEGTQFSKSRHTPRGQGPPPHQPLPITKSRHITPNLLEARVPPTPTPPNPPNHGVPSESFLIQIPIGHVCVCANEFLN